MTLTASRCLPVKPQSAVDSRVNRDGIQRLVDVERQAGRVHVCPPLLTKEGPSFEGPSFVSGLGEDLGAASCER